MAPLHFGADQLVFDQTQGPGVQHAAVELAFGVDDVRIEPPQIAFGVDAAVDPQRHFRLAQFIPIPEPFFDLRLFAQFRHFVLETSHGLLHGDGFAQLLARFLDGNRARQLDFDQLNQIQPLRAANQMADFARDEPEGLLFEFGEIRAGFERLDQSAIGGAGRFGNAPRGLLEFRRIRRQVAMQFVHQQLLLESFLLAHPGSEPPKNIAHNGPARRDELLGVVAIIQSFGGFAGLRRGRQRQIDPDEGVYRMLHQAQPLAVHLAQFRLRRILLGHRRGVKTALDARAQLGAQRLLAFALGSGFVFMKDRRIRIAGSHRIEKQVFFVERLLAAAGQRPFGAGVVCSCQQRDGRLFIVLSSRRGLRMSGQAQGRQRQYGEKMPSHRLHSFAPLVRTR
ncbi:MAG: hypothetical protein BWZ10_02501 [candidate division BRC1 bacterium ADurb.BinA364]|nr:MAG: hypothetical protein BWZ10_02501 [candidate division BRC1 bacterium ADurb.BinA364]